MGHTHCITHTHAHYNIFFYFLFINYGAYKIQALTSNACLAKKIRHTKHHNTLTHLRYLHNYKRTPVWCVVGHTHIYMHVSI